MAKPEIPTFDQLLEPVVKALRALGGSGSIDEISARVVENIKLSPATTEILHNPETDSRTELEYRLAWARTYLKKYGILENSARGVWAVKKGKESEKIDPKKIVKFVNELTRSPRKPEPIEGTGVVVDVEDNEDLGVWQSQLHEMLTKKLDPKAFERLIQRLLRESGFIQVEVTGRSGDGGIDGKGIARLHGFMSFHVVFQAKRYQGTISSAQIRDFRGAMVGRGDKGLFITTGTFSRDALREATRDGAPPIDLVDGDQLAEKLKEFRLGVTTQLIEKVTVQETWFSSI